MESYLRRGCWVSISVVYIYGTALGVCVGNGWKARPFPGCYVFFVVDAHRGCTSQEELLVLCLVVLFYLFLSTYK